MKTKKSLVTIAAARAALKPEGRDYSDSYFSLACGAGKIKGAERARARGGFKWLAPMESFEAFARTVKKKPFRRTVRPSSNGKPSESVVAASVKHSTRSRGPQAGEAQPVGGRCSIWIDHHVYKALVRKLRMINDTILVRERLVDPMNVGSLASRLLERAVGKE